MLRRPPQLRDPADRRPVVAAVLGRAAQQPGLLRHPHARAEPDRPAARCPAEPAGACPGEALTAPSSSCRRCSPSCIIGFIWQLILTPLWGIAKGILGVFGLESLFRPWLGLESSALIALSLISVWQFVGIPMMLFYTALIGIPDELHRGGDRRRRQPVADLLADQVPADPAHDRHRRDPDLRRQLQRLRPDLHDEGRAGRAELLDRHHGHALLSGPSSATSCSSATRPWARPSPAMMFLIILVGVLFYLFACSAACRPTSCEDES